MSSIVPDIFIILSAMALCLALVSFWRSLRFWLYVDDTADAEPARGSDPGRNTRGIERQRLLQLVEDIQIERDLGRMSKEEFDAIDRELRERDREPAVPTASTAQGADDPKPPEVPVPLQAARTCHGCGTQNDSDARFCKRCGDRLIVEVKP